MCADNYIYILKAAFHFVVQFTTCLFYSILFIFYFDNSIYRLDLPPQAAIHLQSYQTYLTSLQADHTLEKPKLINFNHIDIKLNNCCYNC